MNGAAGHADDAHAIAARAERRWAVAVAIIIAVLVAMMIFAGVQWASVPPSRGEKLGPRRVHRRGEFVESTLGTTTASDGRVIARLIAQQSSFEPQCIV